MRSGTGRASGSSRCSCSRILALRKFAGSDGGEERPVGFAGVEQCSDSVVGEAAESVGDAFDGFDEVVDGFGGSVGDPCRVMLLCVSSGDLGEPVLVVGGEVVVVADASFEL